MKYYIYHLKRAATDEHPFYVGLTRDPETRSVAHKHRFGMSTHFAILHEFTTEEEATARETELIKWHSEHGHLENLRGVEGTRQARKGMHALLTAERAERKRIREERVSSRVAKRQAAHEGQQRRAKVEADTKSLGAVGASFVVLRGLLNGEPTDRDVALHALEVIRSAPGAMELAQVYIKANIV